MKIKSLLNCVDLVFITASLITFLCSTLKLAYYWLRRFTMTRRETTNWVNCKIPVCEPSTSRWTPPPTLGSDPMLHLNLYLNSLSGREGVYGTYNRNLQMSPYLRLCWALGISLCEAHSLMATPVHILLNLYFLVSHWASLLTWTRVYIVCRDVFSCTAFVTRLPFPYGLSYLCFYLYLYLYLQLALKLM